MEWEAEIVEYVDFIYKLTSLHGNSKATVAPVLKKEIPLIGPRFLPPSYLQLQKRSTTPKIELEVSYLVPLNIIHPLYHQGLSACPSCGSNDTLWDGWTAPGARNVHGIRRDERALGYQLRCKACKDAPEKQQFCYATTSKAFWEKWEHWKIPREFI